MVTPAGKRKAVAQLVDAYGMSERRACKTIGCCRMTMRYKTTRADDAGLRQRMKAIAHERRRFGYCEACGGNTVISALVLAGLI
jgi:putative transposase